MPVCLPNFQPNAFVHAYVNCLDQSGEQQQQQHDAASIPQQQQQSQQQQYASSSRGRGTFLLLLSGSADAFHKLSAAQHSFVAAVTSGPDGGVLARVQAAAVQPGRGRVRVEALPAPLGEPLRADLQAGQGVCVSLFLLCGRSMVERCPELACCAVQVAALAALRCGTR